MSGHAVNMSTQTAVTTGPSFSSAGAAPGSGKAPNYHLRSWARGLVFKARRWGWLAPSAACERCGRECGTHGRLDPTYARHGAGWPVEILVSGDPVARGIFGALPFVREHDTDEDAIDELIAWAREVSR